MANYYAKDVAKEIREKYDLEIPDIFDDEYDTFIVTLEELDPDLASRFKSSIRLDGIGDPVDEAKRASHRHARKDGILRALLMRRNPLKGGWSWSRPKIMGWLALPLVALLGLMFYTFSKPVQNLQATDESLETQEAENTFGVNYRDTETVAIEGEEDPFAGFDEPAESFNPIVATQVAPIGQSQTPQLPAPGGVATVSEPAAPLPAQTTSLNVYPRSPVTAQLSSTPTLQPAPRSLAVNRSPSTQAGSLRLQTAQAVQPSLNVFAQSGEVAGFSNSATPTNEIPPQADPLSPANISPVSATSENDPFGSVEAQTLQTPASSEDQVDALQTANPPNPVEQIAVQGTYPIGASVTARLEIGLVITDEDASVDISPTRVVAKGNDGSVWVGEANLQKSNRVVITFSTVVTDQGSERVDAVALALDGFAGLNASVRETTPALASDLVRGALRGVDDYVQSLGNQSTLTFRGSTPIVSESSVPLGSAVGGSISRLFTPPEGEKQQALVRVAELPRDTAMTILVLEVSGS